MTDDLIVAVKHEDTMIRVRPYHIAPGQLGNDFRRPYGAEQRLGYPPPGSAPR